VGMALGYVGLRLIRATSAVSVPQIETIGVDGRVVLLAAALALCTVAISGLLPAVRCSKADVHDLLKEGGKASAGMGRHRAQRVLVSGQVAVSVVLLIGTGLFAKSLVRLQQVDPGFGRNGIVALDLSLPGRYSGEACARFFEELLARVQLLPGVRLAGITSHLPLSGEDGSRRFVLLDNPALSDEMPASEYRRVSRGYFDSIGMRLVRGSLFTAFDTPSAPGVAIVNEAFVRRFVSGREVLGTQVLIEDGPSRPREIVGVVADVRHFALQVPSVPEVYIPHSDRPWPNMTLVVRGTGESGAVPIAGIRRELASLDKSIPLGKVTTIEGHLAAASATQRFTTGLLATFAAMALLLSIIGIYGLVALGVAERKVELGLRMAIGADESAIVRLMLREGAVLLGVGLALGLCLAALVTPRLRGLLFAVSALDPVIFTLVPLALMAAGICASYWAARAAARVDPVVCMRQ
jgi:putative ABC transport system permease protein